MVDGWPATPKQARIALRRCFVIGGQICKAINKKKLLYSLAYTADDDS